ncbi:Acireductone dioxygenase ARD family [Lactarius pseudohatsudake]|nr:Acireductone dioxygenase ARD family [Lactarius pseudohatsudake]
MSPPTWQRLPHDSGQPVVELDYLRKHGLTLSTVPLDAEGGWEPVVDKMVNERGWDNRDTINVTKEGHGDHSEQMLDKFFTVHMHDDAEIRYILSSSEYPTDRWIRVQVLPGDFIIIPASIYHHFTLD